MSTFLEHYDRPDGNSSGLIIEAKVKTKGKAVNKTILGRLIKFFGKKKENVNVDDLKKISKITKTGFNSIASKLSNNLLSKSKKDDDFYVKSILNGILSSPQSIDPNWKDTESSTIFKTNNGGKLYLFSFKDKDDNISNYVSANSKMDDWFIDKIGKTYELFVASSLTDRKKKKYKPFELNMDDEEDDTDSSSDIKTKPSKLTEPKSNSNLGFLDIDDTDFDNMVNMWGNGIVGYGMFKSTYKYKKALKREMFSNNWGKGYKYIIPPSGAVIYLLQNTKDMNKAVVVFDNMDAVNKAKQLDMIPWLQPGVKLYWKDQDIDNFDMEE